MIPKFVSDKYWTLDQMYDSLANDNLYGVSITNDRWLGNIGKQFASNNSKWTITKKTDLNYLRFGVAKVIDICVKKDVEGNNIPNEK